MFADVCNNLTAILRYKMVVAWYGQPSWNWPCFRPGDNLARPDLTFMWSFGICYDMLYGYNYGYIMSGMIVFQHDGMWCTSIAGGSFWWIPRGFVLVFSDRELSIRRPDGAISAKWTCGGTSIIHVNRMFHHRPSMLGILHFETPPCPSMSQNWETMDFGWFWHSRMCFWQIEVVVFHSWPAWKPKFLAPLRPWSGWYHQNKFMKKYLLESHQSVDPSVKANEGDLRWLELSGETVKIQVQSPKCVFLLGERKGGPDSSCM